MSKSKGKKQHIATEAESELPPGYTWESDPRKKLCDAENRRRELLRKVLQPIAAIRTDWRPTPEHIAELKEYRRDFRQGLPRGERLFAVRIQGAHQDDVPWPRLDYPTLSLSEATFAPGETHKSTMLFRTIPLTTLTESDRPVAYGLIDRPEMHESLFWDYAWRTSNRVLMTLRDSGLQQVQDRDTWSRAGQWMQLIFAMGWLTGTGIECDDCTAITHSGDGDDSTPVSVSMMNMTPDYSEPHAFAYEAIQLLTTDVMLASANLIEWLLRMAKEIASRAEESDPNGGAPKRVVAPLTVSGISEHIGFSEHTLRKIRRHAGIAPFKSGAHGAKFSPRQVSLMAREHVRNPQIKCSDKMRIAWEELLKEIHEPGLDAPLKATPKA